MQGFIGLWKWLATPRSATVGTTQTWFESAPDSNAGSDTETVLDDARFSEQLCRLFQSLEEANQRARLNSRRAKPRHQLARAAGSGIVRPV
jgi:hypothetical protein